MPLLVLVNGLILIFLCIYFIVVYRKTGKENKFKISGFYLSVFILSFLALAISLKLFWNMGVYADENGSSPVLISGGWFWLYMDWVRLGLLSLLCLISAIKIIKQSE
jgi:hypothetical protein